MMRSSIWRVAAGGGREAEIAHVACVHLANLSDMIFFCFRLSVCYSYPSSDHTFLSLIKSHLHVGTLFFYFVPIGRSQSLDSSLSNCQRTVCSTQLLSRMHIFRAVTVALSSPPTTSSVLSSSAHRCAESL